MKKLLTFRLLSILLLLVLGRTAFAQADVHPLYELMTLMTGIDPGLYRNPFDSSDIELVGVFESPSGKQIVIPGFWMQPYTDDCQSPCSVENLQPSGDPTWQVRFSPDEVGHWTYNLQTRDDGTTVKVENGAFDVTPSDHPGFIGVSGNQRYFQYQNGQSYFPIGHDLLWSWDKGGGLETYRKWLQDLSAAGGNYARLLIDDPWFIGLEWKSAAGDYRASQADAARLDAILDMAAKDGISLQLVLLWHQALINYQGVPVVFPENPPRPDTSADWDNYGYNVANGGSLSGPALFFSDARAQQLFRQRLRYIAARWGYSPQVFAWEMIDQIDHTTTYSPAGAGRWLQDMATYLRQIDQGRHLITAGSRDFDAQLAANPALSFTQARFFQRRPFETVADQVVGSVDAVRQNLSLVSSPTLLSEFSLNPWFEPTTDDPNGVSVQTTLWAAAFSGAGGAGMSAYGDTYVEQLGLQRYYPALAAFASAVDWAHLKLVPAEAALVSDDDSLYQPLRVDGFAKTTGQAPPAETRLISADGADVSDIPARLYGTLYSGQLHGVEHYHLAVPRATTFEARVSATSALAGARLVVAVDGSVAAELVLDKGSKNVGLRVPLSVGEHDITLENQGDDWLELQYLEIAQMVAPVRVLTLRDSVAGAAVAWLQNRDYTWDKLATPRTPLLFSYRLEHLPPGRYTVEIWDPLSGGVVGSELTTVGDDGVLLADLVPMDAELALRITRQGEEIPPTATVTPTLLPLATNTPLPSETATNTPIPSATAAPSATPTHTPALTETVTAVNTSEANATEAVTESATESASPPASVEAAATAAVTASAAPSMTPSPAR